MTAPGLLGPQDVRTIAARLGVTPTKKLGQNFVHDPNTVRKIVRLAGITADDHVLEIGPGLGSLTLGMLETGARVTAVELDARLAAELEQTAKVYQPDARLRVLHEDGLRVTAQALADDTGALPTVLVANLPYNVSVPILMHLLEILPGLTRVLVMVQQEVGERIAAQPGSKIYGAPSVKAAWYGNWRVEGTVSRQIFWPVPNVDSVLVGCHTEPKNESEELKQLTFALIEAAFGQRRKMLRQSLRGTSLGARGTLTSTESVSEILAKAQVSETARAEALTIEDFIAIARAATE